jgi:hypothetical protein
MMPIDPARSPPLAAHDFATFLTRLPKAELPVHGVGRYVRRRSPRSLHTAASRSRGRSRRCTSTAPSLILSRCFGWRHAAS